ncbi:apoptosis regulator Bcl-2-like [Diretmus argenteus]
MTDTGQQVAMAAGAVGYDSRDIVEDYLRHKLLKKGVSWRFHAPRRQTPDRNRVNEPSSSSSSSSPSSSSQRTEGGRTSRAGIASASRGEEGDSWQDSHGTLAPPTHLHGVLWRVGDELERRHQAEFSAHVSVLLVRLDRELVLRRLVAVREELFSDGVNWGRIVALLELGGALCVEVVKRERAWQVQDITGWMVESLEAPPLRGWIDDNGGWNAFVDLYGQTRSPGSYWSSRMVFGLAVLGAAGLTLGALFTHK